MCLRLRNGGPSLCVPRETSLYPRTSALTRNAPRDSRISHRSRSFPPESSSPTLLSPLQPRHKISQRPSSHHAKSSPRPSPLSGSTRRSRAHAHFSPPSSCRPTRS